MSSPTGLCTTPTTASMSQPATANPHMFPMAFFDDERLDLLERFIMNPTKENQSSMLEELELMPEPGDEDLGEKAAAKGNLMQYFIALFGTERMMRRSRICRRV
jgi:hypothetical protein